ncbi:unnamed protein product [Calicophoron daubneyi]|uniref:Uncharacterized protein n=1 Tax=Calicophoron daubneyi TaxID=300641 RepID=A0AAV2TUF4_CALDB
MNKELEAQQQLVQLQEDLSNLSEEMSKHLESSKDVLENGLEKRKELIRKIHEQVKLIEELQLKHRNDGAGGSWTESGGSGGDKGGNKPDSKSSDENRRISEDGISTEYGETRSEFWRRLEWKNRSLRYIDHGNTIRVVGCFESL